MLLLHVQSPVYLHAADMFTTSKLGGIVKIVYIHIISYNHCEMVTRESFLWGKMVPQKKWYLQIYPVYMDILTNSVQEGEHCKAMLVRQRQKMSSG